MAASHRPDAGALRVCMPPFNHDPFAAGFNRQVGDAIRDVQRPDFVSDIAALVFRWEPLGIVGNCHGLGDGLSTKCSPILFTDGKKNWAAIFRILQCSPPGH